MLERERERETQQLHCTCKNVMLIHKSLLSQHHCCIENYGFIFVQQQFSKKVMISGRVLEACVCVCPYVMINNIWRASNTHTHSTMIKTHIAYVL